MPVRIYDIAKRLGIENKVVLAKAKELGITSARVPSSSLDKISAEYLENHLAGEKKPEEVKEVKEPTAHELIIVKAPQAPPAEPTPSPVGQDQLESLPSVEIVGATQTQDESGAAISSEEPTAIVAKFEIATAPETSQTSDTGLIQPIEPEEPAEPAKPRVGELVGRIDLPARRVSRSTKPVAKSPTRPEPATPRPEPAGRVDPMARGRQGRDIRREAQDRTVPPGRGPARPESKPPPTSPAFVAPSNAETITLKPPIIVRSLAEKLNRKPHQVIADLFDLKVMAGVNQAIEEETARQLCAKYGFKFEVEKRERGAGIVHTHVKRVDLDEEDKSEDLISRPPVVTIMGHVDHGKTTLLDVIRKSNVASGEAGGITQHIGAYTICVPHPDRKNDLQQITFLDTPGHAAFTAMRARGADVTDIVVLVVAATDGVMPQTIEAINHAKAAGVPILVAVNKCDHPSANPMRARQQLQERGLVSDEWGGETIFVDVSALTKQGIDKLLEMIVLQADLLELKANPNRRAKGNVIESGIAPGGPTASVLVRGGTLRLGDMMVCGSNYGRVRALINDEGTRLKEAGPSVAVKVLGLNGVPDAGSEFNVVEDEKAARMIAENRHQEEERERLQGETVRRDDFMTMLMAKELKELKVVVKADTQGSVEAIVDSLTKIESDKVTLLVIHAAVGTITETDVHLASASRALIIGFHTRLDSGVSDMAKRESVPIKLYSIIYELIDEVKLAMAGLLDPEIKESVVGQAEVRKVFDLSKGGKVAGCIVNSGRIVKGKARVLRRQSLLFEGTIQSLRRFQDEVNEVRSGMECGIRLDGFQDLQPGDAIECFTFEKVAAKL